MDDDQRWLSPADLQHDFEVETLFNEFVESFGGKRVDSLLPASPDFSNADYLFESDNVIAELKCLQADFAAPEVIQKKADRLYRQWLAEGSISPESINDLDLLPRDKKRKIRALYTNPLKRVIEKANRQLRETAQHFETEGKGKLLLIANDGAYSAQTFWTVAFLNEILARDQFSSVEAFAYFSVNRYVELPGDDYARHVWFPFYSTDPPEHLHPFVNRLGSAWLDFLGSKIGGWDDSIKTDDSDLGYEIIRKARHIEPPDNKAT